MSGPQDTQDPREARLPQWAQEAFRSLRRRVAEAESRAEEARLNSGPADSDTLADPYDDVPLRLGKGTRIRFVPAAREDMSWLDVRVTAGSIEVTGGDSIAVRPQSSNVVRIEVSR